VSQTHDDEQPYHDNRRRVDHLEDRLEKVEDLLKQVMDELIKAQGEIAADRRETKQLLDTYRSLALLARVFGWLTVVGAAIGTIFASFFHGKSP